MPDLSKRGLLCGQKIDKLDFCENCLLGKHRRVKFSTAVHKTKGTTKGTVDYIYSDLWGLSKVLSLGGAWYLSVFIIDFS